MSKKVLALISFVCMAVGMAVCKPDLVKAAADREFFVIYEEDDFLYTINDDNETVTVRGYTGYEFDVVIPDIIHGRRVTGLNYDGLEDSYVLRSIYIPESVESIEDRNAYVYDSYLTDIFVAEENKVYVSENGILYNKEKTNLVLCPKGKKGELSNLPESLRSVEDYAFYSCIYLTHIELPEGIRSIGKSAFDNCNGLRSIRMPERLENMGDSAFGGCENLRSIILPQGLKSIGEDTFSSCMFLADIELPEGLEYIGSNAFTSCINLKNIGLPAKLSSLGKNVFGGCWKLTDIYYPNDTDAWDQIEMGSGNEEFESVKMHFSAKDGFECRDLENGTLEITGCYMDFDDICVIPEEIAGKKVTCIGNGAFSGCGSLTRITLPAGLLRIGKDVFKGCGSLQDVYFPKSKNMWDTLFVERGNEDLKSADIHFRGEWFKTLDYHM